MLQPSRPFVVFSLPRSRSAWLSVFLGSPDARCGHDIGPTLDHPEDFGRRLRDDIVGTCETGAAFAWRLIREQLPEAQFVVVRRDPAEVIRSLERFGITGQEGEMWGRARDLDVIAAQPGTLTVEFSELHTPIACGAIYARCLARCMPYDWWADLDLMNIQVDMGRQLELLARRRPQIEALKVAARAAMQRAAVLTDA